MGYIFFFLSFLTLCGYPASGASWNATQTVALAFFAMGCGALHIFG
jgi:hypothetical protein